jgi:pyrroline-5-carboxylate reductase
MSKIAFIGGGNMASSIIGGMLANGFQPEQICVGNPGEEKRQHLQQTYGIATTPDNHVAVADADIVVMAVKPQVMGAVVKELASSISPGTVLVSVAAGIKLSNLEKWLGDSRAIVRVMPNTPSMVRCGAAGLFANQLVNSEQKASIEAIFNAVGISCWVDEEAQIDAVTAVSGSGPAYYFLMMETMQRVGQELGLSEQTARELTIQTALGAAQMASTSEHNTTELRRQVTSPGGTTQAAIAAFQSLNVEDTFRQAMQAAQNRARAMADEFSN